MGTSCPSSNTWNRLRSNPLTGLSWSVISTSSTTSLDCAWSTVPENGTFEIAATGVVGGAVVGTASGVGTLEASLAFSAGFATGLVAGTVAASAAGFGVAFDAGVAAATSGAGVVCEPAPAPGSPVADGPGDANRARPGPRAAELSAAGTPPFAVPFSPPPFAAVTIRASDPNS